MTLTALRRTAVLAGGLLSLAVAGCNRGYGHLIPPEELAHWAVESALTTWKNGDPPGEIVGDDATTIQVVDSKWKEGQKEGQKLAGFEILGEEPGDGPKRFSVRLTLDGKDRQQVVVRYVVLGKQPIWVYREEDFGQPAGM